MIRIGVLVATVVVLLGAWYELSGGADFEPGEHGVTILAEVKPYTPPERPVPGTLQVRDLTPVKPTRPEPRVTSLQERDPLPSRTVRVPAPAPEPARAPEPTAKRAQAPGDPPPGPAPADDVVTALADALRAEDPPAEPPEPAVSPAPTQAPEPVTTRAPDVTPEPEDEIARALSEAVRSDNALAPDPAADGASVRSAGRISGLGDALPLGTRIDDGAAVAFSDAPDLRRVTGTRVNLRGGPATSYAILTQLFEGAEVELLDETGDGWVKLRVLESDEVGWMSEDFLSAPN